MHLLYETEFGSKLYGTNTPLSDTDIKIVYLPTLKDLMMGKGLKNKAESTGSDNSKNNKDDLDIEYIPLQVLAEDFVGGQTYALEIVFAALSPDHVLETVHDEMFIDFCKEISKKFMTSNVKGMIGYAVGQTHKYGIKGSRLGAVNKFKELLLEVLDEVKTRAFQQKDISEGEFGEIIKSTRLNETTLLEKVKALDSLNAKYCFITTAEGPNKEPKEVISLIEKIFFHDIRLPEAISRTEKMIKGYGGRAKDAEKNKGIDWKAVSHAIRITREAFDVLTYHNLSFPFDEEWSEHLKEIKAGNIPWKDVENELASLMSTVDEAKEQTDLEPMTFERKEKEFMPWLHNKLVEIYQSTGEYCDEEIK